MHIEINLNLSGLPPIFSQWNPKWGNKKIQAFFFFEVSNQVTTPCNKIFDKYFYKETQQRKPKI